IAQVRDLVVRRLGPGFLVARLASIERELRRLEPADRATAPPDVRADRVPAAPGGIARRPAELAADRLALHGPADGRALRSDAVRVLDAAPLSAPERTALATYAATLEQSVLLLLDSPRPDRGRPLLAALARLAASNAALASGRVMVLDTFPA